MESREDDEQTAAVGESEPSESNEMDISERRDGPVSDEEGSQEGFEGDAPSEDDNLTDGEVSWQDRTYADSGTVDPCFPPGVMVKTPDGDRRIEDLRPGDLVLAYDDKVQGVVTCPVAQVRRGWAKYLVVVNCGNCITTATRMHPFWVDGPNAWVPAWELRAGMPLRSADRGTVHVHSVELLTKETATYNLEIVQAHNYYVGMVGLLVHNGKRSSFENKEEHLTQIYLVRDRNSDDVKYVGKTVQGADTRLEQHKANKQEWRDKGYDSEPVQEGNWTRYETAVWEQHFIDQYGGARSTNPESSLENKINAIGEKKYDAYKDQHNPCA